MRRALKIWRNFSRGKNCAYPSMSSDFCRTLSCIPYCLAVVCQSSPEGTSGWSLTVQEHKLGNFRNIGRTATVPGIIAPLSYKPSSRSGFSHRDPHFVFKHRVPERRGIIIVCPQRGHSRDHELRLVRSRLNYHNHERTKYRAFRKMDPEIRYGLRYGLLPSPEFSFY